MRSGSNRHLSTAVAALATAALAVACGGTGGTSGGAKSIYFIFTGYAYPYFAPMAQAVRQAAKHYPDLSVKVIDAQNSASQEITDINEAVANQAKGIILNTIQESVTSAAKQAMSKGIPVITIDRDVSDPSARVAFIGDNDETLGKDETQYAVQYMGQQNVPKPWHVVILQGTLGASVTIGRLQGAMDVLQPLVQSGQAQIVLNQSANFATDTAQQVTSTELAKTTDIQLFVCGNDAMALGVITALKDRGITPGQSTFVAGADAQPESLDAIKAGTQLDTVTHSPFVEAYWAVEAMDNYLKSGTKPPADKFPSGNVIIPMTLVTRDNVGQVAAWGTPQTIPPLPYGTSKSYPVSGS
ncbi:MAG TPA: sugar ABC transporter substrate-binding protein [Candidatus Dormibacteraeota bacterium]|nr:sugar ABC transporter substrate-binding protein [Candidatus Dormibacteraeota bacterium]